MIRLIFFAVSIALSPLLACAEYFTIEDYYVNIKVSSSAVMEVREEIRVNFTSPRHGIIRKIPFRYISEGVVGEDRADRPWGIGSRYSLSLYDLKVEGFPFSTSTQWDYKLIKIGSPVLYVSGKNLYRISYKVFGGINFFSNHSELYWNAVGTEWDVPIAHAEFHLELPGGIQLSPEDFKVFTGAMGSNGSNATIAWDGHSLSGATTSGLPPNSGVTVLARFPAGALKNGDFLSKLRLFWENNPLLPVPFLVLLICYFFWARFGKDKDFSTAVVWEIPPSISPTEAGYLVDDKLDNSDLTAMLYYWGARGHLKIEQMERTDLMIFKSKDYKITKLMPLPPNAKSFERIIFNGLFAAGNSVMVSTLRNKFYLTMQSARSAFERDCGSGLYAGGSRGLAVVMGLFGFMIPAIMMFYASGVGLIGLAAVVEAVATGIILVGFARYMPKKSDAGLERYRAVMGFKEFVGRVETPRLEMILKTQPNYYDKMLSYAIVLGVGKAWTDKFADLGVPEPTWYVGASPLRSGGFYSDISSSMNSIGQNFTSSPSQSGGGGSGFSSGGGSSGGGGGGGGGSSW